MEIVSDFEMTYTSIAFFLLLIAALCIFFVLPGQRAKRTWILIVNLIFYAWAGGGALLIVLATAGIVYLISRRMEGIYAQFEAETEGLKPREKMGRLDAYKKRTRRYLVLALFLILAVWIYVKVGKFVGVATVDSFRDWFSGLGILVPLGISYYSLSAIGYLLDIYWRKVKPEHNFLTLLSVMTYFPHIVQGPISKYRQLIGQMNALPRFDYRRVCFGLQRMMWGYIKKMIIADHLALYVDAVFDEPAEFAGVEILLALIFCVFQLYADFSGCIDIVLGISEAIGIELEENFRQPLFSKSASEFWRRWHITLGAWMREYIYLPISTNPRFMKWTYGMKKSGHARLSSFLRDLLPSLAVWILTGLWHGTGLGYLVWGLYWCVLVVFGTEFKPYFDALSDRLKIRKDGTGLRIWQGLRTSILFGIGRMFTVTGWLRGCLILWQQLFAEPRFWVLFDGSLYEHGLDQRNFYVVLIGMVLMLLVDYWHEKGIKIRETLAALPLPLRWAVYYGAILALVVFAVYGGVYDAAGFVYEAF